MKRAGHRKRADLTAIEKKFGMKKIDYGFLLACVLGVLSFAHGAIAYRNGDSAWYPLFGAIALGVSITAWAMSRRIRRG